MCSLKKCTKPVNESCTYMTNESLSCPSSCDCSSNDTFLIDQLDGNTSLSSSCFQESSSPNIGRPYVDKCSSFGENIPVIFGFRPEKPRNYESRNFPGNLKTIRRDNKTIQSLSLPIISSYNMRSLFPKLDSFAEDFDERGTGLSFLSEIWEKSSNKKHQSKLQEMFEMKGILYISTPRQGWRSCNSR